MDEEIAKLFLLPSNLMGVLALAGLGSLAFRRARRWAIPLLCSSTLVFLAFANGPVSFFLVHNLESRSPPFSPEEHPDLAFADIVVLSGHAVPDVRVPTSSAVNASSAFRILEAARLHHLYPAARIIISGWEDVPLLMKNVLLSLGLSEEVIFLEAASSSTIQSAFRVKQLVGDRPFLLVTSAGHMPRSLEAFRRFGMNPIPAPTDYLAKMNPLDGSLLPNANNLMRADLAIHEHVGLLWYRLIAARP